MRIYDYIEEIFWNMYSKEDVLLGLVFLILVLLGLIFESNTSKNSSKRKFDDEKIFPFRYPGGHELPM